MSSDSSLQLSLYLCIRYNDIDVFRILLPSVKNYVDLSSNLIHGKTLLQEAVSLRRALITKELLEAGVIIPESLVKEWITLSINDHINNVNIIEHQLFSKMFKKHSSYKSPSPSEPKIYKNTYERSFSA